MSADDDQRGKRRRQGRSDQHPPAPGAVEQVLEPEGGEHRNPEAGEHQHPVQGDLVEDRQVSDERAHRTGVERHGERRECESGKEELRPARPRGEHSRQRQHRGQRAHVERPLGEVRRLVRRQRGPIRAAPVLGKGQAEPHLGWQRRAGTRRDEGLAQRLHQRQDHDRADRRSKQRGGRRERADADGRAPIGTRGGQPVQDPGGRRKRHDHPALRLPAEVGHPEQPAQRRRVAHCPGAAETIRDQQQPRQQDIGIRVRVHQPHDQVGAEPERHRCKQRTARAEVPARGRTGTFRMRPG